MTHDGEPGKSYWTSAGVIFRSFIQLGLQEVLCKVENKPGDVAEDVHHQDGRQGHGGVGGASETYIISLLVIIMYIA